MNLAGASMREMELQAALARDCDFSRASFESARWHDGTAVLCSFVGADLADMSADRAMFLHCDFQGADLAVSGGGASATFTGAQFSDGRPRDLEDAGQSPGASIVSRPSRRGSARERDQLALVSARERDRIDLLSLRDAKDEELREALVTLLSGCDPKALAAFGTILRFVSMPRPARPKQARRHKGSDDDVQEERPQHAPRAAAGNDKDEEG